MSQARGGFQHSQGGAAGGYLTGPVRAPFVGMSQAVCLFRFPTSFAFGAAPPDVSGEALVSAPLGAQIARMSRAVCLCSLAIYTGPFAAILWRCIKRFACFGGQSRLRPEQILRMSRARRWLSYPRGPRLRGCLGRFASFGGQACFESPRPQRPTD